MKKENFPFTHITVTVQHGHTLIIVTFNKTYKNWPNDIEIGNHYLKLNWNWTMLSNMRPINGFYIFLMILVIFGQVVSSCVYHFECNNNGLCLKGVCFHKECVQNIDCINRGFYTKCFRGRCVPSKQKLCRVGNDCKRNLLWRKCKNYKCV